MNKIKEKIKEKFKNITVKSYIQDILTFINTNLKKSFCILLIISILIILFGTQASVNIINTEGYEANNVSVNTFGKSYIESIETILVVVFAGIVPYMYVPVVGMIAGAFFELTTLSYLVVEKGYLIAILTYIIPLILNISIMCMAVALGMYICKTVTLSHRISDMKNMNFTNFKLQLYEITKKEKKKKALEKEKKKRLEELEKKNTKLDYLQITNVTILLFVLQIIASILRVIII